MKVLLPITYFDRKRGPGQAAVGLARGLSHFAETTVLTHKSEVDLEELNIREKLKDSSLYNIPYNSLKIREFAKKHDIIYIPVATGLVSIAFISNPFKKIVGGPNVTYHFEKRLFPDHYVIHSEAYKELHIDQVGISPDFETAIGLPVEGDIYRPDRKDDELAKKKEEGYLNILYSGRLIEMKGILNLVEAFTDICQDYQVKLNICGKGDLEDEIIDYADRYEKIDYLGFVSDERLADLYSTADIGCFPSEFEPFGLVYLESMASGTATMGVNKGGPKEIITHKEDGYIIEDYSAASIEEGLRELIEDDELREKLGKEGRKTATTDYSPKNIGSKLYQILKEVKEKS